MSGSFHHFGKMSCSERETNPSVYWFKEISGIEDFVILRRVYV